MVFEVSKFLGKPDLEEFDHLKKEDLVLLAKHLKIDFKVSNSSRSGFPKNLLTSKTILHFVGYIKNNNLAINFRM
jgi:hypothetical protein